MLWGDEGNKWWLWLLGLKKKTLHSNFYPSLLLLLPFFFPLVSCEKNTLQERICPQAIRGKRVSKVVNFLTWFDYVLFLYDVTLTPFACLSKTENLNWHLLAYTWLESMHLQAFANYLLLNGCWWIKNMEREERFFFSFNWYIYLILFIQDRGKKPIMVLTVLYLLFERTNLDH